MNLMISLDLHISQSKKPDLPLSQSLFRRGKADHQLTLENKYSVLG